MKFFSKLFLVICILSAGIAKADFYSFFHKYYLTLTPAFIASRQIATRLYDYMSYAQKVSTLPEAPEIVVNFCKNQLKDRFDCSGEVGYIDPELIHIKINQNSRFLETFGNYIIFGPVAAKELQNALEKRTDEASQATIKIYATFIDHEISHLKNNDVKKRLAVFAGTSLLGCAASVYVINSSKLSYLFKQPTNINEFFKTLIAYSCVNQAAISLNDLFTGSYMHYQENRADDYAISVSKNPEALRAAAKTLENFDISLRERIRVTLGITMTNDEFAMWAKEYPYIYSYLRNAFDPSHPSGVDRAKRMRDAADQLETARLNEKSDSGAMVFA